MKLTGFLLFFLSSVHVFAEHGIDSSSSSSSIMDTNIPESTNILWQNHCNGSVDGGGGGGGSGSSSGTSQSSPISINDSNEQPIRKKTWSELKESVTELRKQLSRLSTMVPMNIQFRRLSDSRIRIYFLGMSSSRSNRRIARYSYIVLVSTY